MSLKKKLQASLSTAVLLASVILCAPGAHAFGKGEKSMGVMGGYATYSHSGYVSANFQYTFARHFRLAPEIGYVFLNNGRSGMEVSADMHFPFRVARGFGLYPLAGLTFQGWSVKVLGERESWSRFGGDFGIGADIYFTNFLKMTFQGKYSWLKDTSGFFVGMGLSYVF